jgi:alkaline phosphatase
MLKKLKTTLFCALFVMLIAPGLFAGPKYVFLFIGDGMGANQRKLGDMVAGKTLLMNTLPVWGTTTTHSANREITDSAAAGTALACGVKTNNKWLGMVPVKKQVKDEKTGEMIEKLEVKPVESIVPFLKKRGMKVGIISSVMLNHATPAAFYGHVKHRGQYDDLALQMADSEIDFFGGDKLALRKLKKDEIFKKFADKGYKVIENPQSPVDLKQGEKYYVFRDFKFVVDQHEKTPLTLAGTVDLAINLLDNPKGFFIMCEGGRIDWACHKNDAAATATETIAFDDAVKVAYDFYRKHPKETLIIVTADHETGGLEIIGQGNPEVLLKQKASYYDLTFKLREMYAKKRPFKAVLKLLKDCYGLDKITPEEIAKLRKTWELGWVPGKLRTPEQKKQYGSCNPPLVYIQNKLATQAGVKFTRYGHSGQTVPTTAVGVGAEKFKTNCDNTDIPKKIKEIILEN